jgi:PBSX family phage terminase large subunit
VPTPRASADEMTPARRPYRPVGSALKLLYDRSPEVLLSGPAGTGKSRACLEKIHLMAEKYPGLRALMVRRTRASLTESAMVTFEEHVVPQGHPCLDGPQRLNRHSYRYPNGSEVVCGGLDKPGKVMSSEWHVIYVQEAIELVVDAWEALTIRNRYKSSCPIPYRQLIADTNPDKPTHWLKQRSFLDGSTPWPGQSCRMIECSHRDNPLYWDGAAGRWTAEGADYWSKLCALTGPRLLRLRDGKWVRAEGVVYEWDAETHLIDRRVIPHDWPRLWAVDFGYTNPFCWQHWALDGDNRLWLVHQIYHTRKTVKEHCERIRALTAGHPAPVAIVCDTEDAEGRATVTAELGYPTTPASKVRTQKVGIQAVAERLKVQGDGRPRLYVMRDSLDERDPELVAAKKPTCGEEEFDGYVWADDVRKEAPVDRDNHFMDALRYLVYALDGAPAGRAEGERVLRA